MSVYHKCSEQDNKACALPCKLHANIQSVLHFRSDLQLVMDLDNTTPKICQSSLFSTLYKGNLIQYVSKLCDDHVT